MKKLFAFLVFLAVATTMSFGQAISQNGGSIQGTITDPTGAAVPHATVTISSPETGYSKTLQTDGAGFYAVGPLNPGDYVITVSAPNFSKLETKTVVHTATVTPGSEKLALGSTGDTIEVNAGSLQVNTDQIAITGLVTKEQLDTLPVNGRNMLDVAQIEPGVLLQPGTDFDPTKAGYSALSVNGTGGRTTRILLDGQDITDENVGTTLYNVPSGAISEVQLNRSTQDVSGEVTSSGAIVASSNSGTNKFHGNLFYNFQDAHAGFANVEGLFEPFQRNQFGGYIGGPIIKDKLFFYGGVERLKQDESDVAQTSPTFAAVVHQFPYTPAPFRDTFSIARLDYNGPRGIHLFARAVYATNADSATFGYGPYEIYKNRDNVPGIVGGADFQTGKFTHSIRYGYEKFHNIMSDGTASLGNSIYNPIPSLSLWDPAANFYAGPNWLAPQSTFQTDKQFRYDGTWTKGAHNIKFGAELNRIQIGSFADFYNAGRLVFGTNAGPLSTCGATTGVIGGPSVPGGTDCPDDPVNGYGVDQFITGNGNGYFTEFPGFGLPAGALGSWRVAAYVADTWKVTSSFTLVAGLRWSVDTNRGEQDLPSPTCGTVDAGLIPNCSPTSNPNAYLFDQYQQGLGGKVHQPYANFGPQAGFNFSPGDHKLSLHGGAGIYYESNVFNNTTNARTDLIRGNGHYFTVGVPCADFYPGTSFDNSSNPGAASTGCASGASVAQAAPGLNILKNGYQAASINGSGVPTYIGAAGGEDLIAAGVYAKPYLSPYSIQLNGGVQYQLAKGLVLTADFTHSATLKMPMEYDTNQQGAANTFSLANTQANVAALAASAGCAGATTTSVTCIINAITNSTPAGQTPNYFSPFIGAGIDQAGSYDNEGLPAAQLGTSFLGHNQYVGEGNFILPIGKAAYDALQIVVQQQKSHPMPGIVSSNLQFAYSLSRSIATEVAGSGDQFFVGNTAFSNTNPTGYMGRNDLDHTNQLTMGGSFDIKYGLRVGFVGHFYSAPPTTLTLPVSDVNGGDGEIFRTDLDGDGTTGDLLPGTLPGAYMHSVKPGSLNKVITAYNSTYVGRPTPAGQQLVNSGIFTVAQLQTIGFVPQPLRLAPTTPLSNPTVRTFDMNAGYPIRFLSKYHEGLVITPQVAMYNVFNMSNFSHYVNLADTTLAPVGTDATNYLNGPNTYDAQNSIRTSRQSGTFDQGGPRTTEFQLRIDF